MERPAANRWRQELCDIAEKEVVDEIIFRTTNPRNRLILELMARGGMRIGEVLNLTSGDIQGRKLVIGDPKSGKEAEVVFIPRQIANRLKEYVREKGIKPDRRIFPITHAAARLARILHELPSRDSEEGLATRQPQGLGPEAYLSSTSQGGRPEDAYKETHLRGRSR